MSVFDSAVKQISNLLGITSAGQATKANSLPVVLASDQGALPITDNSGSLTVDDGSGSLTVDGTVTISAIALPLPTGAATETTTAAINTATGAQADAAWTTGSGSIIALLKAIAAKIISTVAVTQSGTWTVQPGNTANTTAWKVDGSAVTQPVSVAAVVHVDDNSGSLTVDGTITANLGTLGGAATAAKQPALGTAGSSSADVISVQGIVAGTPLPVQGTFWQATQPVSGTVTATGTFWQATQPVSGTFWQATQPVSLASVPSHAVTNAGTFAVQNSQVLADNAAFTDGTTKVQPVGYILDEAAGTALTENDIGAARMDSKRAQVIVQEDATTRGQRQKVSANGGAQVELVAPPNWANAQVALSTTAATILIARATRKQATIRNLDTAISIYIGVATVTAANGMLLKPGESLDIFGGVLIQGIAASGTPSVAYVDQYY